MRKPLIPTLVVLVGAGLVALSGCSAPADNASEQPSTSTSQSPEASGSGEESSGAEQTVEESCAIANETVMSVQTEVNEAQANAATPEEAIAALDSIKGKLGTAVEEITNPEVDAALTTFYDQFSSFTDRITAIQQSGAPTEQDQTDLQTAATDLQSSAQELQTLCG